MLFITLCSSGIPDIYFFIFAINKIEMHNRLFFIVQLILILLFYSCSVSKKADSVSRTKPSTERSAGVKPDDDRPVAKNKNGVPADEYINRYKDLAVKEMKRTGIPASITLAQGMIESDYGRSSLAREANNHFGIKCHNGWTGPTVRHDDDRKNDCFRKYSNPEESFYDHSDFLKTGSRYSFLFGLDNTNYKAWAHGLKKAGYATNPDYANMLIRNIEENNLFYFDKEYNQNNKTRQKKAVIEEQSPVKKADSIPVKKTDSIIDQKGDNTKPVTYKNDNVSISARVQRVKENNRIQYIIVRDGDTREKLENEFQLLRWELPKYNELSNNFELVPGQILYLQPKRDKAEQGKEYHNVSEGDTMYQISQLYGIKLKRLYELNRMTFGTEPEPGNKIWLRGNKPVS